MTIREKMMVTLMKAMLPEVTDWGDSSHYGKTCQLGNCPHVNKTYVLHLSIDIVPKKMTPILLW